MANAVRVRVELKENKKFHDREKNFKHMLQDFKRKVAEAGIMHEIKRKQFYESKSEIARRKRRESDNRRRIEDMENKILNGERVQAPSGFVKKVMERHNKKSKGRNNDNKKSR